MSTISMSAVWVKMSTILCLCYTAEMKGVEWREVGQSITIQCRVGSDQDHLSLKMGLNETEIVGINKSKKEIILEGMKERVQTDGKFPNFDILIKNLRENDTGPYWCTYSKTGDLIHQYSISTTKGEGSVLLVVTEKKKEPSPSTDPQRNCEGADMNMVLVGITVAFGVLLIMMLGFVLFVMHKTKSSDNAVKPRRVATGNDVYEDMRGTLRR
ncbi:uncharacterized protein LOC111611582 [Xiphophorus maculatus]|uniref:uncharacterized protein LOC111611582 n=1 Tax=Xiphophorus maculatus TaxID=8083 RepID=UPI000C6EF852|nr:uncharacterized protein LOC111611582 [Xiphophorus maculatus]